MIRILKPHAAMRGEGNYLLYWTLAQFLQQSLLNTGLTLYPRTVFRDEPSCLPSFPIRQTHICYSFI